MSTSRALSDALIRFQIRAQNDPRRYGRRAGLWGGVTFLLAMVAGFVVGGGGFGLVPLILVVALFTALAVGLVVTIAATAAASVRRGRVLPPDTEPADVREARSLQRSGELSGHPDVDRIARIQADRILENRVSPGLLVGLFLLVGGINVANGILRFLSGGPSWVPVVMLAGGLFVMVIAVFMGPAHKRGLRRARAFAKVYDTTYGGTD
ncbi:hypothetical protein ACWGSK_07030 [Nocardiopsis sp. NPDC055551]